MFIPPPGLSAEAFDRAVVDHIAETYRKTRDGYVCKACGGVIMQTACHVSIHSALFQECAGGGEVKAIQLPYCPKCEPPPRPPDWPHGCVHE